MSKYSRCLSSNTKKKSVGGSFLMSLLKLSFVILTVVAVGDFGGKFVGGGGRLGGD